MNKQLRSHIAIAAPARREAAGGTGAPLRLVLGFEPRWFHVRCGIDFREPWHRDPACRRATLLTMRAELQRAFPATTQWSGPEAHDANTIAGCFGVGLMPAVFGLPLRYYPDRWPHPEPGAELSDARVEALHPDELLTAPFVSALLQQIDSIAATSTGRASSAPPSISAVSASSKTWPYGPNSPQCSSTSSPKPPSVSGKRSSSASATPASPSTGCASATAPSA